MPDKINKMYVCKATYCVLLCMFNYRKYTSLEGYEHGNPVVSVNNNGTT